MYYGCDEPLLVTPTDIKNLKFLLYNSIYGNEEKMNELILRIQNNLGVFYINYSPQNYTIDFKVKKSLIKLNSRQTLRDYCMSVLNLVFAEFFRDNIEILNLFNTYNANINYITDSSTVCLIYNLAILNDNVFTIQL